jgi:hypothetical protein
VGERTVGADTSRVAPTAHPLPLQAPTPTPLPRFGRGETNKFTRGFPYDNLLMIIFLSKTQHNRPLSPESGERMG